MHFFYNTNKILFILIFIISYWFNSIVNANIYIVDNFKFSEKISNIKKNRSNIIDKIKIQAFEELKKRLLVEDDLKLIKSKFVNTDWKYAKNVSLPLSNLLNSIPSINILKSYNIIFT